MVEKPKPIAEALKDGTKYILWCKNAKDWITGQWRGGLYSGWYSLLGYQLVPSHFVDFIEDPTCIATKNN